MLEFSPEHQFIIDSGELKLEIEEIKQKVSNQDKNIELVFTYLDKLIDKKIGPRKRIGYMPDDL